MNTGYHIPPLDMERYYLDQVNEPELGQIEEHLLWCQDCSDRMEATERFIELLRAGGIRGGYEIEYLAEDYRPHR